MPLDPKVKLQLEREAASGAPPQTMQTPTLARELSLKAQLDLDKKLGGPIKTWKVADLSIKALDGHLIPVREYVPTDEKMLPVLVFFHGGGWVVGSLETSDSICREIASKAGCIVLSVDYRLAPEHRFPAGVEDCYQVTKWISEKENARNLESDPERVAVAGDSAGGNLAAVISLLARDRGGPKITAQVLIYPVTNYSFQTKSYEENGRGFGLEKEGMKWFWDQYISSKEDGENQYASPIRAESLAELPQAFVLTAEYDVLRDEGEAYAEKLKKSKVPVTMKRYDGMVHGFLDYRGDVETGRKAMDEISEYLRTAFKVADKGTTSG